MFETKKKKRNVMSGNVIMRTCTRKHHVVDEPHSQLGGEGMKCGEIAINMFLGWLPYMFEIYGTVW